MLVYVIQARTRHHVVHKISNDNRKLASTTINYQSSKSHSIFMMTVHYTNLNDQTYNHSTSSLTLTQSNLQSLSTLSKCICCQSTPISDYPLFIHLVKAKKIVKISNVRLQIPVCLVVIARPVRHSGCQLWSVPALVSHRVESPFFHHWFDNFA